MELRMGPTGPGACFPQEPGLLHSFRAGTLHQFSVSGFQDEPSVWQERGWEIRIPGQAAGRLPLVQFISICSRLATHWRRDYSKFHSSRSSFQPGKRAAFETVQAPVIRLLFFSSLLSIFWKYIRSVTMARLADDFNVIYSAWCGAK
jgi:hypothetical protein